MTKKVLRAEKPTDFRINARREDVESFVRQGDNLVVKMKNGDQIVLENFFVVGADGEMSHLTLVDGPYTFTAADAGRFAPSGVVRM